MSAVSQADLEAFGNYVCGQEQISCLQGRSLTWKCPGRLGVATLEGSCAGSSQVFGIRFLNYTS